MLDVKNLTISFLSAAGKVEAVKGINFFIEAGETLGLVGESGSGKSVTALSITRLLRLPPALIENGDIDYLSSTGEVVNLLALSLRQMLAYRGAEIAMVFQEPMTSLNPVFTCGRQIRETLLQHHPMNKKQAYTETLGLLEQVQLKNPERIYRSYPHQLSGGQKQRVLIAMAISGRPNLLIADEPTTALDVKVQKEILALLGRLKDEYSMALLLISHDLNIISDIADRVAVMKKGEIVESGTADSVFQHPQNPYTQGLLACRPPLDKKLRRLPVIEDFSEGEISSSYTEYVSSLASSDDEIRNRRVNLYEKTPLLEVQGMQAWFPTRRNFWGKPLSFVKAVDDVSFEVFPGETLGLIGPSGCGKTTIGRTMLKLVNARSGRVYFDGKEISALKEDEFRNIRRQLQMVFQDPYGSLNPKISVGKSIEEPIIVHKLLPDKRTRMDRVMKLLDDVGLGTEYYSRYPSELSGGERQRVCIARALASNPRFIIFDESVSSLDVSIQAQVLNLIADLREQFGFTSIFITHDLPVVRFISDRVMVMDNGKIDRVGWPEEVNF